MEKGRAKVRAVTSKPVVQGTKVVGGPEMLATSRTQEGADTTREATVSSTRVGTVNSRKGVIRAATVMNSKEAKVITRDIIVKKRLSATKEAEALLRTMINPKVVDMHPPAGTRLEGRSLCGDPVPDLCRQARRRGDIRKDKSEKSSLPRLTGGGTGCLHLKKSLIKKLSVQQCTRQRRTGKT